MSGWPACPIATAMPTCLQLHQDRLDPYREAASPPRPPAAVSRLGLLQILNRVVATDLDVHSVGASSPRNTKLVQELGHLLRDRRGRSRNEQTAVPLALSIGHGSQAPRGWL